MTETEALALIQDTHGNARFIKPDLYAATVDGERVLFRIKNGNLEQRVDIDIHSMRWEEVG